MKFNSPLRLDGINRQLKRGISYRYDLKGVVFAFLILGDDWYFLFYVCLFGKS